MELKEIKSNSKTTALKITGNIDIYSVGELKEQLLPYVEKKTNLELDLKKISKIDTAGYQLIVLLQREQKKSDKEFKIVNPSEEISRIFTLYGESI